VRLPAEMADMADPANSAADWLQRFPARRVHARTRALPIILSRGCAEHSEIHRQRETENSTRGAEAQNRKADGDVRKDSV
jgi:hypothetical protein